MTLYFQDEVRSSKNLEGTTHGGQSVLAPDLSLLGAPEVTP